MAGFGDEFYLTVAPALAARRPGLDPGPLAASPGVGMMRQRSRLSPGRRQSKFPCEPFWWLARVSTRDAFFTGLISGGSFGAGRNYSVESPVGLLSPG